MLPGVVIEEVAHLKIQSSELHARVCRISGRRRVVRVVREKRDGYGRESFCSRVEEIRERIRIQQLTAAKEGLRLRREIMRGLQKQSKLYWL